jgi:outer membrane lipoprotein SlyB
MFKLHTTSGSRVRLPVCRAALAVCAAALLIGCAGPRPVIYGVQVEPASRATGTASAATAAQSAERSRVDRHVAECMEAADRAVGRGNDPKTVLRNAGVAAAVGAVAGGVWGLVKREDAGLRTRAGGAAAAAGSIVRDVLLNEPDEVYRSHVERCMTRRGHDVLGWR